MPPAPPPTAPDVLRQAAQRLQELSQRAEQLAQVCLTRPPLNWVTASLRLSTCSPSKPCAPSPDYRFGYNTHSLNCSDCLRLV